MAISKTDWAAADAGSLGITTRKTTRPTNTHPAPRSEHSRPDPVDSVHLSSDAQAWAAADAGSLGIKTRPTPTHTTPRPQPKTRTEDWAAADAGSLGISTRPKTSTEDWAAADAGSLGITQGSPDYTVQKGDTLTDLAQAWGVSIDQIADLNHLDDPNKIGVGQQLARPEHANSGAYIVQDGDTLGALSQKWGVGVDEIAQANGIADPNRIITGQELVNPARANTEAWAAADAASLGDTASPAAPRTADWAAIDAASLGVTPRATPADWAAADAASLGVNTRNATADWAAIDAASLGVTPRATRSDWASADAANLGIPLKRSPYASTPPNAWSAASLLLQPTSMLL